MVCPQCNTVVHPMDGVLLHEVRGVPNVVTASTSKTMQKVRGVSLVVDAST